MPTPFSYFVPNPVDGPTELTPYTPDYPTTPYKWTLVPEATAPTVEVGPSSAAPVLPCPIQELRQADFLALFDRLFPEEYIEPLKDPGPGYEMLQGYAKIGERLSQSAENTFCDAYILSSTGGSFATGTVQLYRPQALTTGIQVAGQTGLTASIVTGAAGGRMRVTGLTGMTDASAGRYLVVSNADGVHNNGTFLIAKVNSPTSVDVVNVSALIPDPNNGGLEWSEQIFVVTVKAGTIVAASASQAEFVTLADVTFQPTDLGPFNVAVQSLAKDYAANLPGTVLAADGSVLEGEIDTIVTLVEDPPFGDPSVQVLQVQATAGGSDPALDQHGADRGLPRGDGEPDQAYMSRIRTLPDTISPDAFDRTAKLSLDTYGATFTLIETWELTYQTCYDAPINPIPGSSFDPSCFVYDDPRLSPPYRDRYLSQADFLGGVVIVIQPIPPIELRAMVYDDPGAVPADFTSSVGIRAISAYDLPTSGIGSGMIAGCYDGFDSKRRSVYKGLWDALQRIKPAGVTVELALEGS